MNKNEPIEPERPAVSGAVTGSVNGWAAVKYEKLDDLDESLRYRCRLVCADCGGQLNVTSEFSKKELREAWTHLCFSSGLVAGKCPKGCRSTFSDCNINTRLVVEGRSQNKKAQVPHSGTGA